MKNVKTGVGRWNIQYPYNVEPIALTKKETDKDFISTAFAWMGTIFVLIWRRHV